MPDPAESLEWWPDYDGTLIWRGAERVPMSELGVSVDLQEELTSWLSEYNDDLLFGETAHSARMRLINHFCIACMEKREGDRMYAAALPVGRGGWWPGRQRV